MIQEGLSEAVRPCWMLQKQWGRWMSCSKAEYGEQQGPVHTEHSMTPQPVRPRLCALPFDLLAAVLQDR